MATNRRLPRLKTGIERLDALFGKWADAIEQARNWSAASPLQCRSGPEGIQLWLARTPSFYAKLSGSTSPYAFVEQYRKSDHTWADLPGGRTGTDAYEDNAKGGLGGKVVKLKLLEDSTWGFGWIADGPPPCNPTTTKICGRVNSSCGGVVAGVVIEATGPTTASSPSTITATTDSSGNYCLSVPYAGTWPVVAHTPCGDVSQNANATCGATINNVNFTATGHNLKINVDSDCVSPVTSAYYTMTRTGQPIVRPALPGALPVTYCLQPGDYVFSFVGNDCYEDASFPITMGCSAMTQNLVIPAKQYNFPGTIGGSCGPIQGATLVATGGGGISKTVTSDSDGKFLFTGMPAQCFFTITASKDRFTTQTFPLFGGTYQVSCFNVSGPGISLEPAPGYACFAQCCREPLKMPMPVTDSLGTHTLSLWPGLVYRTPCIIKSGVTVTCPCGTLVEDGSVAYFYTFQCENVTGKITLTRVMLGCFVGLVLYPVQSGCDGSGNPTSTCGGYGSVGEASVVTPGKDNCGPLNHEFSYSIGWSDTATIDA